jgi:tetratricopeptide (TPR) repeat protein
VGALPFEPKELRQAGFEGIRRIILEMEPLRPSTRISTLGKESSVSARARRTTVLSLRNQLRGDLDWITMKALEKDRGRRYSSPMDLSRDIERHLRNLPVDARPPTLSYRLSRFVQRNRIGVVFACILIAIVFGAGASLAVLYARSVKAERQVAREATTASEALEFMVDLFRASDPFESGAEPPTARELLDKGAAQLAELEDQPEVQIRLMRTIGNVYRELGSFEESFVILQAALHRQLELTGSQNLNAADLQHQLAYNRILSEEYDRGEALLVDALATRRELAGADSEPVMVSLTLLSFCRVRTGRFPEAETAAREAMKILERRFPDHHRRRADILHNLGWSLFGQNQIDEAKKTFEESLRVRRHHSGHENPANAWTLNLLGMMLAMQEDEHLIREGIVRLEEALALNRKVFDGSHVEIAYNLSNLSTGYMNLGEYSTAEQNLRDALDMGRQFLDERGGLAGMNRQLARCLLEQESYEAAETVLIDHYARLEKIDGTNEQRRLAEELLSTVYSAWGRSEEFKAWQRRTQAGLGGDKP